MNLNFSPISTAWHLRLRQYYPGQEVINEHNDPNLAETPHYKEKQTILPNPISAECHEGKKAHTPMKRTHDGKIKKERKDPLKSPMINEQSSPKEAEEAKIDMRKLIIEHKTHKKSSSSSSPNNISTSKKHTSSSSSSSPSSHKGKNDKDKHKSGSTSDSHRSHSSAKKSHSDKHRRDENRKASSSSSNHSSSSEKKSNEIASKKVDVSKPSPSQSVPSETTPQSQDVKRETSEVASPVQVSSSHSNTSAPSIPLTPSSPSPPTTPAPPTPDVVTLDQTPCVSEQQPMQPAPPVQPPFNILPPLPKDEMPQPPPPPPPPIDHEAQSLNKSNIMPDSSTQQSPQSPAPTSTKVRKLNNGDKTTAPKSDLLGSIMASMDSPRNTPNF